MLKLALPLALAITVLSSCDEGGQVELSSSTISGTVPDKVSAKVSPDQVCADTTYTDTEGNTIQGRRNCKDTRVVCEKMGDTFCMMEDKSLYGVLDKNLTEENIKKDLPFLGTKGNLLGDLEPCTENGQTDCIVPDDALSMSPKLLKSKVLKGQVVANVTGEFDPGFPKLNEVLASDTVNGVPGTIPACTADGDTTCRADNTYRAVNQTELIADRIRSTVTLGGVTGTYTGAYGACSSDNQTLCITTPNYISVDRNALEPAKIRTGIVLAGVTGSLTERAANCAADGAVGCTTTASYPAADFGRIAAANIKNGANVAGTNGLYPSATHKLTTDTPAIDLTAGNFEARMASTTSFEYWDAAGNLYTSTGDGDLVPANIITGTTIFGVVGAMAGTPAACSDSLALNCVASATHKAVDVSKLLPENIKNGVTLDKAGTPVVGLYPSATHPLVDDSTTADLSATSFESSLASAASYEFWDSHGTKYTQAGSTDLIGGNIVTGKTLFSVAGSLATRPENCSDGLRTACVTTSTHPSYDPSELHESVIKSGVTIADVTGKYPSITYKLDGADTTLDLTQGNFTSQLSKATTFEYFDSTGQRYTGQGDTLLAQSHLRSGTTIHDVTGSITATSGNCTAGNQTGCVATSSYPALRKADLKAGVIKAGATVMGVAGQYPSTTFPLTGSTPDVDDLQNDLNTRLASNDSFEFFDASGTRHVRTGTTDLTATNIANAANIFDVAGSMAEQPSACTTEGDTGCLASATYPSFDKTVLTEGVIKNGVSIGGVAGKYPSASYPLPGALVTTDLNALQFNDQVAKHGAYEYWDSTGTRHTKVLLSDLDPATILAGETIFKITGTAAGKPANCSAGTTTSCVTTTAFPSYKPADVSPGIIKAGTVIGSVMGKYPSSTFPLPNAGNTTDLVDTNFNTRVTDTAFFEYWDSTGSRHTGTGSAHIKPENIKNNVNVFGVVGGIVDASSSVLAPHQIRYGVTINGVTGTLKLNCRNNRKDSSSLEVDDVNAGGGYIVPTYNEWGNAHNCTQGVFQDVSGGGGCSTSNTCIYKDSITGLRWRQYPTSSNVTWSQAKNNCLSLGGGWRLPTYKETATAYNHGLRNLYILSGYQGGKFPDTKNIWTSTTSTMNGGTSRAYIFNMGGFTTGDQDKTSNSHTKALCVKY